MSCYTETEVADRTCCLAQIQFTDTRPASPSADPIMPTPHQPVAQVSRIKHQVLQSKFKVVGIDAVDLVSWCDDHKVI